MLLCGRGTERVRDAERYDNCKVIDGCLGCPLVDQVPQL